MMVILDRTILESKSKNLARHSPEYGDEKMMKGRRGWAGRCRKETRFRDRTTCSKQRVVSHWDV